jgi:hypothetical protein
MASHLLWRLAVLTGALAAGVGSAAARAATCSGVLAPGNYDSLNVPAGIFCVVNSGTVTVAGNVTVEPGANLGVGSPAKLVVNGSLSAVGAIDIVIVPTPPGAVTILGSVSLTGTTDDVLIVGTFVGGTLSVTNSNVSAMHVESNNVAGNMLIQNNKTGTNADIDSNTIGGSLVCTANTLTLVIDGGSPITVGGAKVGQVKDL